MTFKEPRPNQFRTINEHGMGDQGIIKETKIQGGGHLTTLDGARHSFNDKPALSCSKGDYWYKRGILHRDGDKPAIIETNWRGNVTKEFYYKEGVRYTPKKKKKVKTKKKTTKKSKKHAGV